MLSADQFSWRYMTQAHANKPLCHFIKVSRQRHIKLTEVVGLLLCVCQFTAVVVKTYASCLNSTSEV